MCLSFMGHSDDPEIEIGYLSKFIESICFFLHSWSGLWNQTSWNIFLCVFEQGGFFRVTTWSKLAIFQCSSSQCASFYKNWTSGVINKVVQVRSSFNVQFYVYFGFQLVRLALPNCFFYYLLIGFNERLI